VGDKIGKDLIAASATPLVLAILNKGPSYGYAIIQAVRELSGGELEWSEGMLYPVLHRMEDDELIASYEERGDNGRKRKYYKIAAAGRRALAAEVKKWDMVQATLARALGHA
jgi:PadR family transcriptional regulator, regulatory protein PadR